MEIGGLVLGRIEAHELGKFGLGHEVRVHAVVVCERHLVLAQVARPDRAGRLARVEPHHEALVLGGDPHHSGSAAARWQHCGRVARNGGAVLQGRVIGGGRSRRVRRRQRRIQIDGAVRRGGPLGFRTGLGGGRAAAARGRGADGTWGAVAACVTLGVARRRTVLPGAAAASGQARQYSYGESYGQRLELHQGTDEGRDRNGSENARAVRRRSRGPGVGVRGCPRGKEPTGNEGSSGRSGRDAFAPTAVVFATRGPSPCVAPCVNDNFVPPRGRRPLVSNRPAIVRGEAHGRATAPSMRVAYGVLSRSRRDAGTPSRSRRGLSCKFASVMS